MRHIRLTIAYDGTDYRGWQVQPGQPTVQGALTEVARQLTQENLALHGAGRTDAGVHALGQVASFKTQSHLAPEEFLRGFNALLPPAIRVTAVEETGPDFHARWLAKRKRYEYAIFRGRVVPPFRWRYVLHDPWPLDFERMAEAARLFEGEHDFTSFSAASGAGEESERAHQQTVVRRIYRSEMLRRPAEPFCANRAGDGVKEEVPAQEPTPEEWIYAVEGNSFLRYMVRKIVGTLIEIGRGRMSPDDVPQILARRDRTATGPTAPPQGLCLMWVEYPDPTRSLDRGE